MRTSRPATAPGHATSPTPAAGRCYRANGLTVRSAIELPLMDPGRGEPDATIAYGPVPDALPHPLAIGPRSEMARGELLLEIKGLARYWVHGGRTVLVAPEPGADEDDVRVFIMSSVMAALAHQNGFLPLHASAVEVDGACVLFVGGPGAGKSTLAAALYRRGYPLVADDIGSISVEGDGRPVVHPGYRHVKLWSDALAHLGPDLGDAERTRARLDKYSVRLRHRLTTRPLPLRKVYALAGRTSGSVELVPLTGRAKMGVLHRETYRRKFIRGFGNTDGHFALCSAVAAAVPMAYVRRPADLSRLGELLDRLEADFDADGAPAR